MISNNANRREAPSWELCVEMLASLPSADQALREQRLGVLLRSQNPGIHRRTLAISAVVMSDDEVVSLLRQPADDVLRNAGLEILKLRGRPGLPLAIKLLDDDDSDVALQAVLAVQAIGDPTALQHVRRILRSRDPNVVHAALAAIGHLGDGRVVDDLIPHLDGDDWSQMAAIQSLGELRSGKALEPLGRLLGNLVAGPLAAEAIARIGGAQALTMLSKHWLEQRADLGGMMPLALLAHVAEGVDAAPELEEGLREALVECLGDDDETERAAAATCILTLGPGIGDLKAVEVLTRARTGSFELPTCLASRTDLISELLRRTDPGCGWGWQLVAVYPKGVGVQELARALPANLEPPTLGVIISALEKVADPEVATLATEMFFRVRPQYRHELAPVLRRWNASVEDLVAMRDDVRTEERVVLAGLLDRGFDEVVPAVAGLANSERVKAVEQLLSRPDVLIRLPWRDWLAEDFDVYCPLLAEVVSTARLYDLAGLIREVLRERAELPLIRAVGALEDSESAAILIGHLSNSSQLVRVTILDALGNVGGPEAREVLRRHAAAAVGIESQVALAGLARCATDEELGFFRGLAVSPVKEVRQQCAETLARFPMPENLSVLLALAADPEGGVARCAMRALEMDGT